LKPYFGGIVKRFLTPLVLAYEKASSACSCQDPNFKYYPQRANLNAKDILSWTEETFDSIFADSSVARLGLERLKRNAAVCVANAFG